MDRITITCSACQAYFVGLHTLKGQCTVCPKCRKTIKVETYSHEILYVGDRHTPGFVVFCPECKVDLKLDERHLGTRIFCINCHHKFLANIIKTRYELPDYVASDKTEKKDAYKVPEYFRSQSFKACTIAGLLLAIVFLGIAAVTFFQNEFIYPRIILAQVLAACNGGIILGIICGFLEPLFSRMFNVVFGPRLFKAFVILMLLGGVSFSVWLGIALYHNQGTTVSSSEISTVE